MPADMNDYFKKKKPEPSSGSNNNDGFNFPQNPFWDGKQVPVWAIITGALIVLLVLFRPFTVINSGEVGIKVTFGKFSPEPLIPGCIFIYRCLSKSYL